MYTTPLHRITNVDLLIYIYTAIYETADIMYTIITIIVIMHRCTSDHIIIIIVLHVIVICDGHTHRMHSHIASDACVMKVFRFDDMAYNTGAWYLIPIDCINNSR